MFLLYDWGVLYDKWLRLPISFLKPLKEKRDCVEMCKGADSVRIFSRLISLKICGVKYPWITKLMCWDSTPSDSGPNWTPLRYLNLDWHSIYSQAPFYTQTIIKHFVPVISAAHKYSVNHISVLCSQRTFSRAFLISHLLFIKDTDLFLLIFRSVWSLHSKKTSHWATLEIKHMYFMFSALCYHVTVGHQSSLSSLTLNTEAVLLWFDESRIKNVHG